MKNRPSRLNRDNPDHWELTVNVRKDQITSSPKSIDSSLEEYIQYIKAICIDEDIHRKGPTVEIIIGGTKVTAVGTRTITVNQNPSRNFMKLISLMTNLQTLSDLADVWILDELTMSNDNVVEYSKQVVGMCVDAKLGPTWFEDQSSFELGFLRCFLVDLYFALNPIINLDKDCREYSEAILRYISALHSLVPELEQGKTKYGITYYPHAGDIDKYLTTDLRDIYRPRCRHIVDATDAEDAIDQFKESDDYEIRNGTMLDIYKVRSLVK